MAEFELIADGLRFPEAPVVMEDGSVIVVEIERGCITRCWPGGRKAVIATPGGGPNGLAIGPDGKLYCCNNGGFHYVESNGYLAPHGIASDYSGGRIERIDIETGGVEVLYKSGDNGVVLRGPNDIVFDAHGGFWFTDHGIRDLGARTSDLTGIYYALADGSSITEVVFPTEAPNGIGLSPDGSTLYWAETHTGRVYRRSVAAPGELVPVAPVDPSVVLCGLPGLQLLDSLAVDGTGNVCVATLVNGGITVIASSGEVLQHIPTGDLLTTNICFGGEGHGTAFITASGTGKLLSLPWPHPGLPLAHSA